MKHLAFNNSVASSGQFGCGGSAGNISKKCRLYQICIKILKNSDWCRKVCEIKFFHSQFTSEKSSNSNSTIETVFSVGCCL